MIIMRKILVRPAASRIKAFTLLESLLVLSITSFLVLLFTGVTTKAVKVVRGELFVASFEQHYKDAQFLAGATGQPETIAAEGKNLTYGGQKMTIPEEVSLSTFSISFDKNGNNSSLKKIVLRLPEEGKTISYQLEMGSGKYQKTIQ